MNWAFIKWIFARVFSIWFDGRYLDWSFFMDLYFIGLVEFEGAGIFVIKRIGNCVLDKVCFFAQGNTSLWGILVVYMIIGFLRSFYYYVLLKFFLLLGFNEPSKAISLMRERNKQRTGMHLLQGCLGLFYEFDGRIVRLSLFFTLS